VQLSRRHFAADANYLVAAFEKVCPKIARLKRLASLAPSLGLGSISISQKVYKPLPPCTIVLIGNIQSIRNKWKMAKPEIVFKVGAVRASIFRNTIQKNGKLIPLPKVVIEVRYKDKTGQWNGTNSLSVNELPKAILALQKAFEYLMEHKEPGQAEKPEIDSQ
jgi:hypothetical protein